MWIYFLEKVFQKKQTQTRTWAKSWHVGTGQRRGQDGQTDYRLEGKWELVETIRTQGRQMREGKATKRGDKFQNKTGNDKPKAELHGGVTHVCGVAAARANSCHQGVN